MASDDDVFNTDTIRVDYHDLGDLDPYEVIQLLAEEHPHDSFAWQPEEGDSWLAGRILLGRNNGGESVCVQCAPGPQWTDWVDTPCETHEPEFTLEDLERALPSITERQEAAIDRAEECDHWQQQCFPQGGCGCPCTYCEVREEE